MPYRLVLSLVLMLCAAAPVGAASTHTERWTRQILQRYGFENVDPASLSDSQKIAITNVDRGNDEPLGLIQAKIASIIAHPHGFFGRN